MRTCAMLAVFAIGSAALAVEAPEELKPLDLKGVATVQPKEGDVTKPTEITSAEELAKSPLFGAGAADKLAKQVDFAKQKLVVFAWSGSGQDKLMGEFTVGKGPLARFTYAPGKTRDLRQHFVAFAVDKKAEVWAPKR